jgi:cytidylate kinase
MAIAERLGLRRVAFGDVFREMADKRQMTALQLNQFAERDLGIDEQVDKLQRELADSGEQVVVDSRLAWFFFPRAFKVHLLVDPTIGAQRVMSRRPYAAEAYSSLADAMTKLRERSDSERDRFLMRYGVDRCRLRNYDLVCDTSRMPLDEIVELVLEAYEGLLGAHAVDSSPLLFLDPTRIYPSEDICSVQDPLASQLVVAVGQQGPRRLQPIEVASASSCFYASLISGHQRLSAALQNGFSFVPAQLMAEGAEEVVSGISAATYFSSQAQLSRINDWNAAHGIEIPLPPHLLREVEPSGL